MLMIHSLVVYKPIIVCTSEWVAIFSPYHPSIWSTILLHDIFLSANFNLSKQIKHQCEKLTSQKLCTQPLILCTTKPR